MTAPAAPTITAIVPGDGSFRITVDGDAGITNRAYYRLADDTSWTLGGSVSGDGDITVTGLTNGVAVLVQAVSINGSSEFSLPSAATWVLPGAAITANPVGKISNFLTSMRSFFLNSSALGAWIQSVGGVGYSTSGRVLLGRRPQTSPDVTYGPVVYVRRGALRVSTAGAENTYLREMQVMVDIVWYEDRTAANIGTGQMNYLDALMDEMEAVGYTLSDAYGGQFLAIDCPDLDEWDEENPNIHHLEFGVSVFY